MKRISQFIIMCLFLSVMNSCQKNERDFFDIDYSALNIWLGTQTAPIASSYYNFIGHHHMDSVMFHARISGLATDYDRPFTLEVVRGDVDRITYYLGDYMIPAGEIYATFPIHIGKPDGFDSFRYADGTLVFRVKANEYFSEGAIGTNGVALNRLQLIFQNSVSKPWNWDADTYPYYRLSYFFGSYSNVKYEFMINTLGISDFRILYGSNLEGQESNVISWAQAAYFQTKCQTALATYNSNSDNIASGRAPLKDENNFEVAF